jgi:hypothetical protein
MDIVASGTAFDPRGVVFIKVGSLFISVAFEAGFVLETAQALSCGWDVRVVTG